METSIEVGILGATGMVGQHFIKFLQGHPWFDLTWLGASDRSAGKKYRDAAKWHLDGSTPASVADLIVEESKPGNGTPKLMFSAMDASVATAERDPRRMRRSSSAPLARAKTRPDLLSK